MKYLTLLPFAAALITGPDPAEPAVVSDAHDLNAHAKQMTVEEAIEAASQVPGVAAALETIKSVGVKLGLDKDLPLLKHLEKKFVPKSSVHNLYAVEKAKAPFDIEVLKTDLNGRLAVAMQKRALFMAELNDQQYQHTFKMSTYQLDQNNGQAQHDMFAKSALNFATLKAADRDQHTSLAITKSQKVALYTKERGRMLEEITAIQEKIDAYEWGLENAVGDCGAAGFLQTNFVTCRAGLVNYDFSKIPKSRQQFMNETVALVQLEDLQEDFTLADRFRGLSEESKEEVLASMDLLMTEEEDDWDRQVDPMEDLKEMSRPQSLHDEELQMGPDVESFLQINHDDSAGDDAEEKDGDDLEVSDDDIYDEDEEEQPSPKITKKVAPIAPHAATNLVKAKARKTRVKEGPFGKMPSIDYSEQGPHPRMETITQEEMQAMSEAWEMQKEEVIEVIREIAAKKAMDEDGRMPRKNEAIKAFVDKAAAKKPFTDPEDVWWFVKREIWRETPPAIRDDIHARAEANACSKTDMSCEKFKARYEEIRDGFQVELEIKKENLEKLSAIFEEEDKRYKRFIAFHTGSEKKNSALQATSERDRLEQADLVHTAVRSQQDEQASWKSTRQALEIQIDMYRDQVCGITRVINDVEILLGLQTVPFRHCALSDWEAKNLCSKECGGGVIKMRRTVTQEPSGGGLACGRLKETIPCNTDPCPVHCKVGPFSAWSACVGKRQSKSRSVLVEPAYGGRECKPLMKTRKCKNRMKKKWVWGAKVGNAVGGEMVKDSFVDSSVKREMYPTKISGNLQNALESQQPGVMAWFGVRGGCLKPAQRRCWKKDWVPRGVHSIRNMKWWKPKGISDLQFNIYEVTGDKLDLAKLAAQRNRVDRWIQCPDGDYIYGMGFSTTTNPKQLKTGDGFETLDKLYCIKFDGLDKLSGCKESSKIPKSVTRWKPWRRKKQLNPPGRRVTNQVAIQGFLPYTMKRKNCAKYYTGEASGMPFKCFARVKVCSMPKL